MPVKLCSLVSLLPADVDFSPEEFDKGVRIIEHPALHLQWRESAFRPDLGGCLHISCNIEGSTDESTAHLQLLEFVKELPTICDSVKSAELIMVMPCPIPNYCPKMADLYIDPLDDSAAALFQKTGVVVLPSALSMDDLTQLQTAASGRWAVLEPQILELRASDPENTIRFLEVTERDRHRFDVQFAKDDQMVLQMAKELGPWLPLINNLLGEHELVGHGMVVATVGTGYQYWHSDGPHLGASADWDGTGGAAPYAICVFVPLIDLTEETGFTQFWIGSHLYEQLCVEKGEPYVPGEFNGICAAGDVIMYDFRVLHRGMPNTSSKSRPVLYFLYGKPGFHQDYNFGIFSIFDPKT